MLLAIVGIIMSYIQPRRENHKFTTAVLIAAGLMGTTILSWNRIRTETAHNKEVGILNAKIGTVQSQNTTILQTLTTPGIGGAKIGEAERRQNIEKVLRNEYILSHNPVDPDIIAGLKMPPDVWMNQRLQQMGERWAVREEPRHAPEPVIQMPTEEKMAHVVFSLVPFGPSDAPVTMKLDPFTDQEFTLSISAKVVGDTPAENLQVWIRECEKCDWVSPNPVGFVEPNQSTPFDRGIMFMEVPANVSIGTWSFTIRVQRFPQIDSAGVGCFYACKNCPIVDWRKPQLLYATKTLKSALKLQFPSISYIPEPVKK